MPASVIGWLCCVPKNECMYVLHVGPITNNNNICILPPHHMLTAVPPKGRVASTSHVEFYSKNHAQFVKSVERLICVLGTADVLTHVLINL